MPPFLSHSLTLVDQLSTSGKVKLPFWDKFSEGYEHWPERENEWDRVLFNGQRLAGTAEVKGAASNRIDVQKVNGKDGGALVERGQKPSELDIDVTLWTPAQWEEFQAQLPYLYRPPHKLDYQDAKKNKPSTKTQTADIEAIEKRAIQISHPGAAMLKVYSVIVQSVTLPVPGPVVGSKLVTLKCVQYVPPNAKANAIRKIGGTAAGPIERRVELPTRNQGHWPAKTGEGKSPTGLVWSKQGIR